MEVDNAAMLDAASDAEKLAKMCWMCKAVDKRTKSCCGNVKYCGKECQNLHWPFHKLNCTRRMGSTRMTAILDAAENAYNSMQQPMRDNTQELVAAARQADADEARHIRKAN